MKIKSMCHELRESSYGLKIESFKDNMIIFSKLISEWCKNFLFTQQVCWISSMHIKHLCNIFVKVSRVLRPVVHMRFQVCKISNMCAILLIGLLRYLNKLYLYFNELFIWDFKCAKYQMYVRYY